MTKVGPRLPKALVMTRAWAPNDFFLVAELVLVSLHRNGCLCLILSPALAPFAPKRKGRTLRGLAPAWHLWSSWLASWAPREVPHLDLSASSRASIRRPCWRKLRVVRLARLGHSRGS